MVNHLAFGGTADGKSSLPRSQTPIQNRTQSHANGLETRYHEALEKMIREKIEHGGEEAPVSTKKKKPSNVVDLVSVLERSIGQTQARPKLEKAASVSNFSSRAN